MKLNIEPKNTVFPYYCYQISDVKCSIQKFIICLNIWQIICIYHNQSCISLNIRIKALPKTGCHHVRNEIIEFILTVDALILQY